jgi:glycogen debranching enzyme
MAEPPIALCEVQGYAYAAKRTAAQIARALQEPDFAARLDNEAEILRVRFEDAFWCEEIGTYSLALDGRKKQCRVRTSNAGHALFCKIASQDRAEAVTSNLLTDQMFFGVGRPNCGCV